MKTIVLGGGVAGIAASVKLARCGAEGELLEASRKLGGRIAEIALPEGNFPPLDYGQHAISTAYENFFNLLEIIGSRNEVTVNGEEKIIFTEKNGRHAELNVDAHFYPFNLLAALFRLSHLTATEKIALLNFFIFIKRADPDKYKGKTFGELSKQRKQGRLREKFWDKIIVSIFNTKAENVNAKLFLTVMRKIFFNGKAPPEIILPKKTLNAIVTMPAIEYLTRRNFTISFGERVLSLKTERNKIIGIVTNKREITDFDYVISALPPHALSNVLPDDFSNLKRKLASLEYSPILTAYIKLKRNDLTERKYLLVNSTLDWLFNFGDYVAVVVSSSDIFNEANEEEIKKRIIVELNEFFSVFSNENVLSFVLVIIKKSTIMSDNLNYGLREQIDSPFNNLHFAGDWHGNVYPPTIENAVFTAYKAVEEICSRSLNLRTIQNILQ